MAFRKAVTAEALKLPECLHGKFLRVAVLHHAGDELFAEFRDTAGMFESRHGAAELIGLAGGKPCTFDCNAHGLFLK